ncbi:ribose transport system ATP-binding protein [Natronincola peptidivorans]|uniref:Ribose transport system ATP-binding protein n=1 Tax=Natronincola peptidivorans TaxID=426128 RepID=A0A1I0E6T4_9FIRM|nr:sugar ABC transporter ATP-binding protein [Natronincola peptidivorans]SET40660.1 ribose transport system ATP-binding protein [Natronincola peptidivorans]
MKELLRMEGIEKSFPGVKALSNVNIDVRAGELHALLGENGAGKSTLMKVLAGVYKKDNGKIYIKGEEIEDLNTELSQKLGISIIYQEFNLFPDLSVAENIFIRREPKNSVLNFVIDDRKLNKQTEEILSKLHLNIKPKTLVKNLSVAEQQMVEIAKALSMNAEILVMDEPTAALTESEIVELFKVIKELKQKGVGIIYISHRLEELEEIADRVTILRDGKYIKTVNYKDTTVDQIITAMVGRDLEDKFPPYEVKNINKSKILLNVKKLTAKNKLNIEDFKLYKGEILGIYGLVGAGRTEFAKVLFGKDKCDDFEVYIQGERAEIKSPIDAINYGLGYLTEDRKKDGLALNLSVEYNINLPSLDKIATNGIIDRQKAKMSAEKYIDALKIKTPGMFQLAKNLSGGNQQKIIIAKWLMKNSKIIIFDEPTRGIDVGAKYEVYELMIALAKKGVGVIMISSELPEIIGISDRVVIMREGRFTGELEREELKEKSILSYAIK